VDLLYALSKIKCLFTFDCLIYILVVTSYEKCHVTDICRELLVGNMSKTVNTKRVCWYNIVVGQ
jgi:hypothetical protein